MASAWRVENLSGWNLNLRFPEYIENVLTTTLWCLWNAYTKTGMHECTYLWFVWGFFKILLWLLASDASLSQKYSRPGDTQLFAGGAHKSPARHIWQFFSNRESVYDEIQRWGICWNVDNCALPQEISLTVWLHICFYIVLKEKGEVEILPYIIILNQLYSVHIFTTYFPDISFLIFSH